MSESNTSAKGIVDGLRSKVESDRTQALDALFPDSGGALMLHINKDLDAVLATSTEVDAGRCFNALLFLSQQFGKHLGLRLAWVPEPEDPTKIVVAPAGQVLRGPGGQA